MRKYIVVCWCFIFSIQSAAATCERYFTVASAASVYSQLLKIEMPSKGSIHYYQNPQTLQTLILYVEKNSDRYAYLRTRYSNKLKELKLKKLIQQLKAETFQVVGVVREKNGFYLSSEFHRAGAFSLKINDKLFFDYERNNKSLKTKYRKLKSNLLSEPTYLLIVGMMFFGGINFYSYYLDIPFIPDRLIVLYFELVVLVIYSTWYMREYYRQLEDNKALQDEELLEAKFKLYYPNLDDIFDALSSPSQNTMAVISEEFVEPFNEILEQAGFKFVVPNMQQVLP